MNGLPPDAAVWRSRALPPAEEFAAELLERQDLWFPVLVKAVMGAKRVQFPPRIQIVRPGEEPPGPRKVETDGRAIAAFFRKHFTG